MPSYQELIDAVDEEMGYTDIVGGSSVVQQRAFQQLEILTAPIPRTTLSSGASVTVNVGVAKPFRARRLAITGTNLAEVQITSLKVGNVDQYINGNPMPAALYTADNTTLPLKGDTAQPGVGIDLGLRNLDTNSPVVTGGFSGEAAT